MSCANFPGTGFSPGAAAAGPVRLCKRLRVRGLAEFHRPIASTDAPGPSVAALIFVDIPKGMPLPLVTRPFGWDTLAICIFEMPAEGERERAALPAVAPVVADLPPIVLLLNQTNK